MFSDEILQLSMESSRLIIRTRRTVGYLLKWTERRCSRSRKRLFHAGKDSSPDCVRDSVQSRTKGVVERAWRAWKVL